MPGRVAGRVTAVAENGDLLTDISAEQLRDAPTDHRVTVRCDEHVTNGLFTPDHAEPEMTFLALLRPDGNLQLVIVGDSARLMLGISVGEQVVVEWA